MQASFTSYLDESSGDNNNNKSDDEEDEDTEVEDEQQQEAVLRTLASVDQSLKEAENLLSTLKTTTVGKRRASVAAAAAAAAAANQASNASELEQLMQRHRRISQALEHLRGGDVATYQEVMQGE